MGAASLAGKFNPTAMTEIETLRHSSAHVLATAILRIWPEAQFAAGPPVENGFYYDVDLPHRITPEDFARVEEEMRKEIKANHRFERIEVSERKPASSREKARWQPSRKDLNPRDSSLISSKTSPTGK